MRVALFANTEWYLFNFRLALARVLRERGCEVVMISPPGPYGARLEDEGFRWIPVAMDRRSLHPLREMGLVARLRRLLRDERIDLIHGFTIKCAVYGALAARFCDNLPRVNAVAGLGYMFTSPHPTARLSRWPIRRLMQFAFHGARSRIVVQNADDQRVFQEGRLAYAQQVALIPSSGVDTKRFCPNPERAAGERFRVVMAARLLRSKGVAEFAAAAERLRHDGVAVDCVLAGAPDPGNPDSMDPVVVRRWADEGILDWQGHNDDIATLFRNADAVVLPSYYGEGLPRSLIEGGACGLPLITTDRPGCRDVVSHGVEGLIVPERDFLALADAIRRLAGDREESARFGMAARNKVLMHFDERIVIERTLAIYRALLPGFESLQPA